MLGERGVEVQQLPRMQLPPMPVCTLYSGHQVTISAHRTASMLLYAGQVTHRSRLYESAPAYVTDQPRFLNGAILATTRLPPLALLDQLKAVEVCSDRH